MNLKGLMAFTPYINPQYQFTSYSDYMVIKGKKIDFPVYV